MAGFGDYHTDDQLPCLVCEEETVFLTIACSWSFAPNEPAFDAEVTEIEFECSCEQPDDAAAEYKEQGLDRAEDEHYHG
jgi:hypothetical protein